MDDKMNPIVVRDDFRQKSSRSGFCVLVVDSSRVCLTITTRILFMNKYKVARYGAQALSMLRQSKIKIDLVLTEVQLPDMCGIEFMEKVREVKRMPVVFISSFGNPGEKMKCLSKGGDFCFEKPMAMKEASWLWQFKILNRRAATTFGNVKESSSMKLEEVVGDNGYVAAKKRRIFWATEFYGKSGEGIIMRDANGNTIPKSTRMEEQFGANASRMQNRAEGLQFADVLNGNTSVDTTLSLRLGSFSHENKNTQMDAQMRGADKGIEKKDDAMKPEEESLLSLGLSLGYGSQIYDQNQKMNNTGKGAKVEASDAASSSAGHGDLAAYNPIFRGLRNSQHA